MTGRVWAIALNTFREAVRNKVLYGILVVVFLLNCGALVLGEMSLHEEARVARDVGLGGVSLFGSITAIVLGVSLLYGEIQKKTIHTILSKPIERHEFVLGKYLGMIATLTLMVALFALVMAGILRVQGVAFTGAIARALVLAYLEVLIVAAVAVFFSSFSTPFLSGVFTFAIFFLGRVSDELRYAADKAREVWVREVAHVALKVLPDLHLFSPSGGQVGGKHVSVHGEFVSWSYVGHAGLYALLVVAILLLLAVIIFHERDFA